MASIRTRTRADGSQAHQVLWREGGHRDAPQRSETFDGPGAHDRAVKLRDFLNANGQSYTLAADAYRRAYAEGITVAQAYRAFIADREIDGPTAYVYGSHAKTHILPVFGDRAASGITDDEVKDWVKGLTKAGASPRSVRAYHQLLSAVMKWCIESEILDTNPCKGIRLPRPDKTKARGKLIEREDFEDIVLPETPADVQPLVRFLAGTGLRIGEATALTVSDFRPANAKRNRRGYVTVTKTWARTAAGGREVKVPKSEASIRDVTVSQALNDELVELCGGRAGDEWLFTHKGGSVRYSWLEGKVWHPAALRMADPKRPGGHLRSVPTMHALRHSHGSWLLAEGMDLLSVSRRLGHANIGITANTYGHVTSRTQDQMGKALDDLDG